jgi:hypothetical protein
MVRTARLASIRHAWAERLGVDAEHVDGELEARFAALVEAITGDDLGAPDSAQAAVIYSDMYTIGRFVTDARRRLVREEMAR